MEADKVFHTYDEKRIYNLEGFSDDQPLINNRMSIVSGVSGLSKMTATTHQTQKKEIDWENILHGVQKIETIIVEDRADSVLSNGTDVTINDNKINILRSHHLIAVSKLLPIQNYTVDHWSKFESLYEIIFKISLTYIKCSTFGNSLSKN